VPALENNQLLPEIYASKKGPVEPIEEIDETPKAGKEVSFSKLYSEKP